VSSSKGRSTKYPNIQGRSHETLIVAEKMGLGVYAFLDLRYRRDTSYIVFKKRRRAGDCAS
jgi:hypothetical protein